LKTNKKKTSKISKRAAKKSNVNKKGTETSFPKGQSKPAPVRIFITGESPLVEQYADVCSEHGYDVYISWNEMPAQKPEFNNHGIKITNIIPANTSLVIELTNIDIFAKKKNLERFDSTLTMSTPIISSSVTVTATEQSLWLSGKHRLVGFAALPMLIQKPLVEIAPTVYSPKETLEVIKLFFRSIGKEIEIVQDRIGMVLPRILCRIINESAFAITEDIASPQDIDTALKLGVKFPLGPFELAEQIGLKQVYAVLSALHTDLQEERYRIAPLLKQLAMTRV
jgi:3-hydroxybutyryl-CoA dehydrogenase